MSQEDKTQNLDVLFKDYSQRADKLYEFVIVYSNYMHMHRDYGTGHMFTMLEIHILTYIQENKGTTVTEIASKWNKSKSAVSQIVTKLVERGVVIREKHQSNSKTVLLNTTPEGERISNAHKLYDLADISITTEQLLQKCTQEEIASFYKVVDAYLTLFEN